jgi:hypothetical protein
MLVTHRGRFNTQFDASEGWGRTQAVGSRGGGLGRRNRLSHQTPNRRALSRTHRCPVAHGPFGFLRNLNSFKVSVTWTPCGRKRC